MKFYSEKLNEMFDSIEELEAAENQTAKKKTKKATAEVAEEPQVPTKKQLASEIDKAEESVKEAYANYEVAKSKVEELSKEYLDKVNSILETAKKAIKDAEGKRYDAIRKFNDAFGAYQVTYTGAKAADELSKAISNLRTRAFKDLFWF